MDHGPVLLLKVLFKKYRLYYCRKILAEEGGKLLSKTLPLFVSGEITEDIQNEDLATYTPK